jgi:hypothetical protein
MRTIVSTARTNGKRTSVIVDANGVVRSEALHTARRINPTHILAFVRAVSCSRAHQLTKRIREFA